MFRFLKLRRKKLSLIPLDKANIQLVSLHIPKTAGTSFREILIKNYGQDAVAQFDIIHENNVTKFQLFGKEISTPMVPKNTKVLHGHFEYHRLLVNCPQLKQVPVITWLRDPVNRVVSNYQYLNSVFEESIKENKLATSLYPRLQNSLQEFASREYEQNRMSKFCKGLDLSTAFFVGKVENYAQDLDKLGNLLNWQDKNVVHTNVTEKKKKLDSEELLSKILAYNEEDVALYNSI